MIVQLKNGATIVLRQLHQGDFEALLHYLQALSADTKKRFEPHPFTTAAIKEFYNATQNNTGYIACDIANGNIVAYAIIKHDFLQHDAARLQSYGLQLSNITDATYAPSVADAWQGTGVGGAMLTLISRECKTKNVQRIILWGGVQQQNVQAVNFYTKKRFTTLGYFDYNGANIDMCLLL
jgi:diamine N-acetyltransferase